MNHQRRRILKRIPMFTIGRNPKARKAKPGTVAKRCKPYIRSKDNQRTSIFMCLQTIPLHILFELCGPARTVINRYKRIQDLETSATWYTSLSSSYKGLPYNKIQREIDAKVYWLRMEQTCIRAFRKLVACWIYKKNRTRELNTEDPATCEVPVKPIRVFDGQRKGTYIFEAATLKRHIESALSYAEWMFPYPTKPMNPLTNLPFTDAQLLRILHELRRYGFGSWMIESYKRLAFNLSVFRDVFIVPIKLRALHQLMQDPNHEDMIDLLSEFIEDEFDYHEIPSQTYRSLLPWAVQHAPTHPYIETWRKLFSRYTSNVIVYGENESKMIVLKDSIHDESLKLFGQTSDIRALMHLRTNQHRQAQAQIQPRIVTLYPSVTFVVS